MARRIVNRCPPGTLLAQGDKMGLIRFGSRTDVYLPAAKAKALVKKGDRGLAG
ncbi:MAG: phosphatidylserine decarboxylase [Caldilineaceae bacterium]